jgi:hypothetical protein
MSKDRCFKAEVEAGAAKYLGLNHWLQSENCHRIDYQGFNKPVRPPNHRVVNIQPIVMWNHK